MFRREKSPNPWWEFPPTFSPMNGLSIKNGRKPELARLL